MGKKWERNGKEMEKKWERNGEEMEKKVCQVKQMEKENFAKQNRVETILWSAKKPKTWSNALALGPARGKACAANALPTTEAMAICRPA